MKRPETSISSIHTMAYSPLISVIDDDETVGLSLTRLLTMLGFETEFFRTGAAFLVSLTDRLPDCILLDMVMPGLSGAEVIRQLRLQAIQVPVILISGDCERNLAAASQGMTSLDILGKPYCVDDLFIKVNQALGCRGYVPQRCPWPCPVLGGDVWNCAMSGYSEDEREKLNQTPPCPPQRHQKQDCKVQLLAS